MSAEEILIRLVAIVLLISPGYAAFGQQASTEEQLAASRKQIDKIDRQIVELINQRAAVVEKVGKTKAAAGLPIRVPRREQEVLKRVVEIGASGPLPLARLQKIYSILLEQMRDWEQEQQQSQKP